MRRLVLVAFLCACPSKKVDPPRCEPHRVFPKLLFKFLQTLIRERHLFGPEAMRFLMSPSSDCRNAGGETEASDGTPGCWKHGPMEFGGRLQGDFPHVEAADYSSPDD